EMRPGITGLAQVQLPPDVDVRSVGRKLAYDLLYLREMGPWLDLRILLATLLKVLGVPFGATRRLLGLPCAGDELVTEEAVDEGTAIRPSRWLGSRPVFSHPRPCRMSTAPPGNAGPGPSRSEGAIPPWLPRDQRTSGGGRRPPPSRYGSTTRLEDRRHLPPVVLRA